MKEIYSQAVSAGDLTTITKALEISGDGLLSLDRFWVVSFRYDNAANTKEIRLLATSVSRSEALRFAVVEVINLEQGSAASGLKLDDVTTAGREKAKVE
jgi:hypothetical protein